MNPLTRWFIDSGMRRGIPDPNARARTITLYIDKKPFEQALQLPTEKTVYALLVDRSGKVLWLGASMSTLAAQDNKDSLSAINENNTPPQDTTVASGQARVIPPPLTG
ncbi:MAG: hypothetical protein P4M04_05705 [Acidobacteriota bacterium]|nr:hypothetical protein [Acidobacteriota bacterium]